MSPIFALIRVTVPLCWKANEDCSSGAIWPSSRMYVARFWRAAGEASTLRGTAAGAAFLPQPASTGSATAAASVSSVARKGIEGNLVPSISFLVRSFMVSYTAPDGF